MHRIAGQVGGVEKMIADDRYCIDILTQFPPSALPSRPWPSRSWTTTSSTAWPMPATGTEPLPPKRAGRCSKPSIASPGPADAGRLYRASPSDGRSPGTASGPRSAVTREQRWSDWSGRASPCMTSISTAAEHTGVVEECLAHLAGQGQLDHDRGQGVLSTCSRADNKPTVKAASTW